MYLVDRNVVHNKLYRNYPEPVHVLGFLILFAVFFLPLFTLLAIVGFYGFAMQHPDSFENRRIQRERGVLFMKVLNCILVFSFVAANIVLLYLILLEKI